MNDAFAETTFYDKDYLLVLPDQACLACVGDLYQSIQSIQDNANFLVIWVQSKSSIKDTITSNFPIVLKDKEGVLQRYETNIGGPTFFKIENNQLFNQTNLNAEIWKELSIIYQW